MFRLPVDYNVQRLCKGYAKTVPFKVSWLKENRIVELICSMEKEMDEWNIQTDLPI